MRISEIWRNGVLVSSTTETDAEEQTLRDRIDAAITDLQVIQAAALTTEATQIQAIKGQAEILEKLLKFLKRRFL